MDGKDDAAVEAVDEFTVLRGIAKARLYKGFFGVSLLKRGFGQRIALRGCKAELEFLDDIVAEAT